MAYCEITDLQLAVEPAILLALTDDDKDGESDEDVIERAIADADAQINAYIRKRYYVPLETVPDFIRKVSVDLAIFNLFKRRAAHFETPQWLVTSHTDALDILKRINRAEIDLGVEPPPAISTAEVATTSTNSSRLFTDETLEDF